MLINSLFESSCNLSNKLYLWASFGCKEIFKTHFKGCSRSNLIDRWGIPFFYFHDQIIQGELGPAEKGEDGIHVQGLSHSVEQKSVARKENKLLLPFSLGYSISAMKGGCWFVLTAGAAQSKLEGCCVVVFLNYAKRKKGDLLFVLSRIKRRLEELKKYICFLCGH